MPFYALLYHIGVRKGMEGHWEGNGHKLEESRMKYLNISDFMINIVFYHFVDMNTSQETHCDNAYKLQPIQIHTWHSQILGSFEAKNITCVFLHENSNLAIEITKDVFPDVKKCKKVRKSGLKRLFCIF